MTAGNDVPPVEVSAKPEPRRSEPVLLTEYLVQEIARAAYFRAQNRGFVPGHEEQDWLEAQSTVLQAGSVRKSEG